MGNRLVAGLTGLFVGALVACPAHAQPQPDDASQDVRLQEAGWTQVAHGGFGDPDLEILGDFAEFHGALYVCSLHKTAGAQIWRSVDGVTWEPVVGAAAATPAGFGDPNNRSINKLLAYGNRLYATLWNDEAGGQLWSSADGTHWEPSIGAAAATPNGFGKRENTGITALSGFQGKIFAGTGSTYCKDGVELWMSSDEGTTWEPVAGERFAILTALARESKYLMDFETFNGWLYLGTGDQRTGGCEIWRSQDGHAWEVVVGSPSPYRAGMGNPSDDMIYDFAVFGGQLYAGLLNYERRNGALWRSPDGRRWDVVLGGDRAPHTGGFGNPDNYGIVRLAPFRGALYAGTTNEQGAELWRSTDGAAWTPVVCPACSPASGFGTPHNRSVNGLAVYLDRLYVGTDNSAEGAEIWRFDPPEPTPAGA